MQFFSEFIFTLLILFFSITSLTGIGYLTATILKFNSDELIFYYTFFGLAISIPILEIIHFFYPINIHVSFTIFILGTLLFFLLKNKYIESFQLPKSKITCTFFVILFLFWLFKSMDSITNSDSAFYHISFIKWINEFPLVGGLGNLIVHFANNHSWFLFVSLLGFSPIIENSYSIAGFLILILSICLIFTNRNKIPYPNILLPILVVTIIFNTSRLSSPSPDLAINIFIIIIFFY